MKKTVRTLSMLLTMAVLMAMFSIGVTVNAASAKITYTFSGQQAAEAGYAEGTITFTADTDGTYRLYWSDDEKALDGYNRIAKFTLSAGKSQSVSLGYHTVIPSGATKIIACTEGTAVSGAKAVYDIPAEKQFSTDSGRLLYKFTSFSDVHIDKGSLWYVDAETHLKEGLQYSVDKGSDYIIISGDVVTNDSGPDKEWTAYQKILSQSAFVNPVWESDGNHDMRQGVESGLKSFIRGSGIDSTKETFDSGKSYFYKVEEKTGDLFLFMSLELNKSPSQAEEFTDEQIAWATRLIEEYTAKGVNIFLVQHSPIKGFGAGDRMSKPYYSGMLNPDHSSTQKLKALLQKYHDIVWVSGHTHEDFEMNYNYSDENGTAAHMLHIPSLAGSTKANADDTGLDRNNGKGFNSQAYFTEVYENKIVYYGVNISDGTIYPKYSYIIDSPRKKSGAVFNTEKQITLSGTTVSLSSKLSEVSSILSTFYNYASYDQYQALKKLYYTYKGQTTADQSIVTAFDEAITALKAIIAHVTGHEIYSVGHEYYFENNLSWSKVYAYAWTGSNNNGTWPGVQLSKSGSYNGHDLYRVTFAEDGQYQNLIFSDGTNQTVDICLSSYQYNTFRTNGTSDGKYKVKNYSQSTGTEEEEEENGEYAVLYYISGSHDWSDTSTLMKKNGEGLYEYTMTAKDSTNISLSLYDKKNKTYKSLSESASIVYQAGLTSQYTLSTMSSRGKSLTFSGLEKDNTIRLSYDPKTNVLTVRTEELPSSDPVNTAALAADTVILGEKIIVNLSAEEGTAPYTYSVSYKKATGTKWTVKQTDGTNTRVAIVPASAVDYQVLVAVTDNTGKTAEKTLTCHVTPALANQSTLSAKKIVIGQKITVNAAASGGAGNYQYAVFFRKATADQWVAAQSFSTNQTVSIKPSAAQDYEVYVKVKDSKGTIVKKYFTVAVSPKLSNTSTISAESIQKGESVTVNASSEGGLPKYTYGVYYKKLTSEK